MAAKPTRLAAIRVRWARRWAGMASVRVLAGGSRAGFCCVGLAAMPTALCADPPHRFAADADRCAIRVSGHSCRGGRGGAAWHGDGVTRRWRLPASPACGMVATAWRHSGASPAAALAASSPGGRGPALSSIRHRWPLSRSRLAAIRVRWVARGSVGGAIRHVAGVPGERPSRRCRAGVRPGLRARSGVQPRSISAARTRVTAAGSIPGPGGVKCHWVNTTTRHPASLAFSSRKMSLRRWAGLA